MDHDTPLPRCLTQRQIAVLIGALIPLRWLTRWTDAPDDIAKFINDIEAALQAPCGEGAGTMLRQSPENPCLLEQSTDGVTWTPAFDYSLCLPDRPPDVGDTTIVIDQSQTTINNYRDIYDGTPGSIFDGTPSDALLCHAYKAWVRTAIETYIAFRDEQEADDDFWVNIGAIILGVAAAITGIFTGGLTAPFAYQALAAALVAVAGILQVWISVDATDDDSLRSDDAIDPVVCAMLQQHAGSMPTFVQWQSILNLAGSLTGDAGDVVEVLTPTLVDEDAYIMLLALADDMQPYEALLPDCSCLFWCRHSKFGTNPDRDGDDGWTVLGGTVGAVSISATEIIAPRQYVRIEYTFAEPLIINSFRAVFTLYNSAQAGGAIQFYEGATEKHRVNFSPGLDQTVEQNGLTVVCDRVFLFVRDTQGLNPASVVNEVLLAGEGDNPFAGGDNCE